MFIHTHTHLKRAHVKKQKSKFGIDFILSFLLILQLFILNFAFLTSPVYAASSPWTQTDWSGGSGQTSWSDSTKFDSSSNVTTSTAGQITLQATSSWYNSSWAYRRKITFNNSTQAENLTNFPVLVKLDSTRINYSGTQDSGQDIRFTDSDGTTLLSYEIEKWDETGNSFVWVKVPQIDASSSTDYIYMYYGNSSAADAQAATSVWDSNYVMVQHLNETSGTTANDSTSNNNDGTKVSATEPNPTTSGQIDGAQDFDGSDDYLNIASSTNLGFTTVYTLSTWVYLDAVRNYNVIFCRCSGSSDDIELYSANAGQSITVVHNRGNGGTFNYSTNDSGINSTGGWGAITTTSWVHLVVTYSSGTWRVYKNGGLAGSSSGNVDPLNLSGGKWQIGATENTGTFTTTNEWDGKMDEVQISNAVRSAAWIAASYKSETDAFNTFASEEPQVQTSGTLTSSIFDTEYTAGAAWGTLTYNATTPSNTSVSVKARTSNSSSMTGATAFSSCTAITSGLDISSNSCVTDSHRYIQYQLSLANTDSVSTPTFQDISTTFAAYDADAPSISLTALSPDPNSDNTPTLSGTATESIGTVSNVQFQMDSTSGSWTACSATDGSFSSTSEAFSCTSSSLSDGSHTMYVRATDSNGNTTSSSYASDAFTIDATAPTISVTALTDPNTDSTPTVSGTATDATTALTTIQFQVDSTSGSWSSCSADDGSVDETSETFTCTSSSLSDGSHTIYIRGTDSATNTTSSSSYGSDSFTIDTTAPTLSLTAISPDPGTDTTPTLSGSVTDATGTISTVSFQMDATSGSWTSCTASDGSFNSASESFTCAVTSAQSDGNHTIYVRSTDNAGNTSSNASDTFTIDTTSPVSIDSDSPADGSYIKLDRPTYRWKTTTDATSTLTKYKLVIDNGETGDFTIDNIAVTGSSDYNTTTYTIHYENFSDSDSSNNYIGVVTKSSSDWGSSSNDGKLKEGKRSWTVTAYDNAGNTVSSTKNFYVDLTNPTLSSVVISSFDILGDGEGYNVVSNTKPKVTGNLSDTLLPYRIIFSFYKQNFLLGIETSRTLFTEETYTPTNTSSAKSIDFSISASQSLDYGKYHVTIVGYDKALNKSTEVALKLWILTEDKAKLVITKNKSEEEKKSLLEELRKKSKVSLPELEKKAKLRRVREAGEWEKFIAKLSSGRDNLAKGGNSLVTFIVKGITDTTKNTFSILSQTLSQTGQTLVAVTVQLAENSNKTAQEIGKSVNTNISNLANNINNNVTKELPDAIQDGLNTYSKFNKDITLFKKNVGDEVRERISETQEETRKDFAEFAKSIEQTKDGIGNLAKQTSHTLTKLNTHLENTGNTVEKEIAKTHKQTSKTLSNIGTRLSQGSNATLRSILKPAEDSKNFAERVVKSTKIAVATFHSYMFDPSPTKIENVELVEIGKDYAIISWKTNHYTRNNKVNYGQTLTYGQSAWGEDGEKNHQVKITGLKAGKKYYFEVMSQNKNYAYDAYYSFETLKKK